MENWGYGSVDVIDRDSGGLFEPPNLTGTPERRLLLAVLERAVLDYVGNDSREVTEAEDWLFGEIENPTYAEFTFSWVCEELDLDMKKIASTIQSMPKRGKRKVAPWYFQRASNN